MKHATLVLLFGALATAAAADLRISSFERTGGLTVTNVFTNGVCTIECAATLSSAWLPIKSVYTTASVAHAAVALDGQGGFYRAAARQFSPDRAGFTNLTLAYGELSTIAGAGGFENFNHWRPEFEGALAREVILSGPHIAMADRAGEIYIADKDSHGIRKLRLDGRIVTVAGINTPDNGPDDSMSGIACG